MDKVDVIRVSFNPKTKELDVHLGMDNEAVLALALRKASLFIDDVLMNNELKKQAREASPIIKPNLKDMINR